MERFETGSKFLFFFVPFVLFVVNPAVVIFFNEIQGKRSGMKKGLLMVFTGNGKGKTTSALGLALRSAGHGKKVCFIQFIKGSWKYGELIAMEKHREHIDFHVTGKGFTWKSKDLEKDKAAAREAWALAKVAILSEDYSLVVLDELTYLLNYGIIDPEEALTVLSERPADLHVAVTGRDAPEELTKAADLVSEITAVKHPYKAGIKAQRGIEF
jgi:cob(I)alamin adenosyltransferase